MKSNTLLSEELKRHLEILDYSDRVSNNVIEEKFKVTFQEQEPETDGEELPDTEMPTPPVGGADPVTPDDTTAPTPPSAPSTPSTPAPPPAPGEQIPPPTSAPGEQTPPPPPPPVDDMTDQEDEVEEIDVTDLVTQNGEIGDTVDQFSNQLMDIETKFTELSNKLDGMDRLFQKIDNLEIEIEKMAPPTPIERMELRSLDSFPYNQRLDNYFDDKKAQYKRLRGIDLDTERVSPEKEYTLTAGAAEEWDDNSIGKSFNPNYDDTIN